MYVNSSLNSYNMSTNYYKNSYDIISILETSGRGETTEVEAGTEVHIVPSLPIIDEGSTG